MKECSKIKPMLSRYIDGDLPKSDHPAITTHLGQCAACRAVLKQYATMKSLLSASYSEEALPRDLTRSLLDSKKTVRGRAFYFKEWRLAATAAAVSLAVILAMLIFPAGRQTPSGPAYILESSGRSVISGLPLGSMIYYEHLAGSCVHSPFVRFSSNAWEERENRIAALSTNISYESPLFDDRTMISQRSNGAYE